MGFFPEWVSCQKHPNDSHDSRTRNPHDKVGLSSRFGTIVATARGLRFEKTNKDTVMFILFSSLDQKVENKGRQKSKGVTRFSWLHLNRLSCVCESNGRSVILIFGSNSVDASTLMLLATSHSCCFTLQVTHNFRFIPTTTPKSNIQKTPNVTALHTPSSQQTQLKICSNPPLYSALSTRVHQPQTQPQAPKRVRDNTLV